MTDAFEHLNALRFRLSNEQSRLRSAKRPADVALRRVYLAQCEREIAGEIAFLAARGIVEEPMPVMSDDELLAALS